MNKLTKAENCQKTANCRSNYSSVMSNTAWRDLNKDCIVLKLHDKCSSPNCICQKQITFTARHFQLDGSRFLSELQKKFQRNKNSMG